jgi:hypothetical protein
VWRRQVGLVQGTRWPVVGMKADRIGSDNTFTTSTSIFFRCGAERILHECGYGCRFFWMSDLVRSRIGDGADAD